MSQLNAETVIARSDSLLSINLEKDVAMMDIEQGTYYGLESVAARIWDLTEQPVSVGEICNRLASEYDVSPERCAAEVGSFLSDLLERKIVRIAG